MIKLESLLDRAPGRVFVLCKCKVIWCWSPSSSILSQHQIYIAPIQFDQTNETDQFNVNPEKEKICDQSLIESDK